jgi:hypothetical protein
MLEELLDEDEDVNSKAREKLAASDSEEQSAIVKELLEQLDELDDTDLAIAALASTGDAAAWKYLKKLADSDDEDAKETFADALGDAKGENRQLFDMLFQLCEDDGEIVKDNALDALETIGSPKAIPRLLELSDPNVPKLTEVLIACSKDATDVGPVVERFAEWLDSTVHVHQGHEGARGLGARAKALAPKLEKLLDATKDWDRAHATCSLHAITGERKYLDLVLKDLGDKKADPRVIAGEYLKDLGGSVLAELKELEQSGNAAQKKQIPGIIKIIERRMQRASRD